MVGGENDLSVCGVSIQGECRNRTHRVAHGKVSDIFAHSIDNTGAIISKTGREYWGFDIFVVAPHRLGAVDADCFYFDTNFVWPRSGNLRFDEFEDFRASGLCEFDRAGHGVSTKSG